MQDINLAVLTASLQKLNVPYTVSGDTLSITPTSSPQMEILPGEWTSSEDNTLLLLNIKEFDVIEWIAKLVTELEKTI